MKRAPERINVGGIGNRDVREVVYAFGGVEIRCLTPEGPRIVWLGEHVVEQVEAALLAHRARVRRFADGGG